MRSLATVPAVIGALLPEIDLLPGILADIVDIELARAGLEGESPWVTQPPRKRLLAFLGRRAAGGVAPPAAHTHERVIGRYASIRCDAQYLAQQNELIARCVVIASAAAIAGIVGTAITHTDVQVAIRPELHVAAIVIAVRRRNVVDQNLLGAGQVVVAECEARDPIDRYLRIGRLSKWTCAGIAWKRVARIVEIDEMVAGESWIDRHTQQAALAVIADSGAEIERSCRQ